MVQHRILFAFMIVAILSVLPAAGEMEDTTLQQGETVVLGPDEWPEGDAAIPYVRQWVEANGYSFTVGSTSISNLSREEKDALCGLVLPEGYVHQGIDYSIIQEPPGGTRASWDWRDHGGETVVESQSPCGSCWSFAGVHAVAAAFKIAEGYEMDISEQHVIDCNSYGYSCNSGGWMEAVYELYRPYDYGFIDEGCYPYIGGDQACYENSCPSMGHIDSYTSVSQNTNSIKSALATGPVAMAYCVGGSFDYYNGGCFDEENGNCTNHAMLIVGYDDSYCGGDGAWIVKNSWGTGWGVGGYIYIQYNTSNVGYAVDLVHYTAQNPTPDIAYAGHQEDDSSGNGDGFVNPGETVILEVDLENTGVADATGISAVLSTMAIDVSMSDNFAVWPNIINGATATSLSPHFTVTFGPSIGIGTTVTFDLDIDSNEGSYSDQFTVTTAGTEDTIHVAIGSTPESGVLPYTLTLWPQLCNDYWAARTLHGRVAVGIASGTVYSNWRSGFTNVSAGQCYTGMFNVELPNYNSLRGDNVFTLFGTDITPPPYNQPPYTPSGDTDTDACTAVGY